MEYEANPTSLQGIAPPEDLGALRARFEDQVKRAYSLGNRASVVADTVFGPRPETCGSNGQEPQSLADLVSDLRSALDRIESGLSRL